MVSIRNRVRLSTLLVLILIMGLAGCGSPAPIMQDRFYSLAPTAMEAPIGSPMPASLLVNDLAARGFAGGRQIIFRTEAAPLLVQRYDNLLWAEPHVIGAVLGKVVNRFYHGIRLGHGWGSGGLSAPRVGKQK